MKTRLVPKQALNQAFSELRLIQYVSFSRNNKFKTTALDDAIVSEKSLTHRAAPGGISCLAFALALDDNFLFHLPLHFFSWEAIQLSFCIPEK